MIHQPVSFARAAGQLAHHANVREDVGDRVRLQRDNFDISFERARGLSDDLVTDGANIAKLLSQDQIRIQFAQPVSSRS